MGFSKFGNKKTVVDGITFDSILESKFYLYLMELKSKGEVKDFEIHKRFEIFPSYTFQGKKIRKIEYEADFVVEHLDGTLEYFDVKGFFTDVFRIKKKMFEYKYQQPLKCIQLRGRGENRKWVEVTK